METKSDPRLVVIQVSLSDKVPLPGDLPRGHETTKLAGGSVAGTLKIDWTGNCLAAGLLTSLIEQGYVMINAYYFERENNPFGKLHRIVRFEYAPVEFDFASDWFKGERDDFQYYLKGLCERNVWTARVHQNPYFENKSPVKGKFTFMVELKGRQGQPPDHSLAFNQGEISLV